jgi:hypothetical protein
VSNNCERAASGPGCKEKTSTERRTLAHCARALSGVLCARAAASNQAVGRTLSTSIVCVCSSSRVHRPIVSLCHCAPPEFTTCRPGCLPAAIIAANTEQASERHKGSCNSQVLPLHTYTASCLSSLIPPDWFTRVMIVYIKCCDFIIRCLKSSCHDTVNASAVNEGLCLCLSRKIFEVVCFWLFRLLLCCSQWRSRMSVMELWAHTNGQRNTFSRHK